MAKIKDLTGKRFGRLVAVRFSERKNNQTYWLFHCDCGKEKEIRSSDVVSGEIVSCGCYRGWDSKKPCDITGKKFGKLIAVSFVGIKDFKAVWLCLCDCGKEKEVYEHSLKSGNTKSCGCYQKGVGKKGKDIRSYTRLYRIYKAMKTRTANKSSPSHKYYGGRGITICDEWLNDFEIFKSWALANGYADDLSIDRIDNDKGYSPDNCRWATSLEQMNNQRKTRTLTYHGQTKSVSEWARIKGVSRRKLIYRLNSGLSIEKELEEPE